jgi:hypothetical protein
VIDVSTLAHGDPCPRCAARRVYAVDVSRDRWACLPYAVPFHGHPRFPVVEHDATQPADDMESAIALMNAAKTRMLLNG